MSAEAKPSKSLSKFIIGTLGWLIISLLCWFTVARIINIPLIWLGNWLLPLFTDGTIQNIDMLTGNHDAGTRFLNQVMIFVTDIPHPFSFPDGFVPEIMPKGFLDNPKNYKTKEQYERLREQWMREGGT